MSARLLSQSGLGSRALPAVEPLPRAGIASSSGTASVGTGKAGRPLFVWTANGTFVAATAGWGRLLTVDGGSGASGLVASSGNGGRVQDVTVWLEPGTYTVTVGTFGAYPNGFGTVSKVICSGVFALWGYADPATYNLGNGGMHPNGAGVYSDISGVPEGFGGAGYNTTLGGYDPVFGGAPNSAADTRANSGGGGCVVGATGRGANGIVKLLA